MQITRGIRNPVKTRGYNICEHEYFQHEQNQFEKCLGSSFKIKRSNEFIFQFHKFRGFQIEQNNYKSINEISFHLLVSENLFHFINADRSQTENIKDEIVLEVVPDNLFLI